MVNYQINLAKSVTSTLEERTKVYHGMITYLFACAVGLVYVTFLAASNMMDAYNSGRTRKEMIESYSAASSFSETFCKNPEKAYNDLKLYAADLALLQTAFSQRTHFLPVLTQLFFQFPNDVAVRNLEAYADQKNITFELIGPVESVKEQQARWSQNKKLNQLVLNIKQVKSGQYEVNGLSVPFVKFECILKKKV